MAGAGCIDDDELLGFADHQLSATRAAEVREHVSACVDCRQVLAELARDGASAAAPAQLFRRGEQLGRYVLDDVIGSGGMGVVYGATDPKLERRVAIKVLKDAKHGQRFDEERRILAGLDHPHIARLLDGGELADGRPWLVMERVEGLPLGEWCEAQRLDVDARLRLFRDVCSAVQFAHQNLVVHRDLKPGNILVGSDGSVKLLDFGIAKLLEGSATATVTGVLALTPAYASPEQTTGGAITTASDVYALGVVLYELLTSVSPYRTGAHDVGALLQAVREEEPAAPSAVASSPKLMRRLSGDLDAIVLMALRKEPRLRYATAEALDDDLRRHLEGLPTAARRGSTAYAAGKWVRRHKVVVAAALSLAAGTVATALFAVRAAKERDRAEARFGQVRSLAHAMLFDYHDRVAALPGSTLLREQLVKDALGYLDSLATESGGDPALQEELVAAYLKIGDVQGDPFAASLGDTAGALLSYRRAETLSRALLEATGRAAPLRLLAQAELKVGDLLFVSGDAAGSLAAYRESIRHGEQLIARADAQADDRYALSMGWFALGEALAPEGRLAEALEAHRTCLKLREALVAVAPTVKHARGVAGAHVVIADTLSKQGDVAGSVKEYEVAVERYEALVAEAPEHRSDLGPLYQRVGVALHAAGETKRAVEAMRKSLEVNAARAAADPADTVAQRNLAGSYSTLGDLLLDAGELEEAVTLHQKVVEVTRQLSKADAANAQLARDAAAATYALGCTQRRAGKLVVAAATQAEALGASEALLGGDPQSVMLRTDVADVLQELGQLEQAKGRLAVAAAHHERARALYEGVLADAPESPALQASLAGAYRDLALTHTGVAACAWWRRSADTWALLEKRGVVPTDAKAEASRALAAASACR